MRTRQSILSRRIAVVGVAALIAWWGAHEPRVEPAPLQPAVSSSRPRSEDPLLTAFLARRSAVQIESVGVIKKILPDDDDGSRHQRFLLEGPSGHTVLVAHNLDLAPRVPGLKPGARIAFNGEYEWNPRGGILHWTHHDPRGEHAAGWIEYRGRRYQ
ncbi:MAG TPA: DUF3465 domain-containing protein [Gammaproteobacteria bacterium]|nr:DUF3465 domain-containing protein [Gammaproteobacteria bacterium]